jgi:hypothetical protein
VIEREQGEHAGWMCNTDFVLGNRGVENIEIRNMKIVNVF